MTQTSGGASAEASDRGGQTPGSLLRAARQRQGLSLQQVAEDLNLDVSAVEAIEADRFRALGAPVHVRGHLRKYASRLGVAPQTVLASYEALTVASPAPGPTSGVNIRRAETSPWAKPSVWLPLTLLASGVAVLWIWKFAEAPPEVAANPSMQTPAERSPEAAAPQPAGEQQAPPETAAATPVAAVQKPEAPVPDAAPAAVAPGIELTLVFEQPSWAEVYDADGARLMFDTGQVGQTRTLSGSAPLTVVLGSAAAVQATVDGRPITIPRRANRDSTRFVVHAGGEVR